MDRFLVAALVSLLSSHPAAAGDGVVIGGTGASLVMLEAMASAFEAAHPDTDIEVIHGLGTGGSLKAVAAGDLDLTLAGRDLKTSEREAGLQAEHAFSTPFAFFTSRRDPASISAADVAQLYENPGAPNPLFGGASIRLILRPEADSDFAYAVSAFPGFAEAYAAARTAPGVPVAQTDQDNADLAESMTDSLATGTLLQMISEERRLRPLPIDGVEPSVEAAASGAWTYMKPLHLVSGPAPSEATELFSAFMLSAEGGAIAARHGAVRRLD
jgi:phosphate transport system substrate-binding protein